MIKWQRVLHDIEAYPNFFCVTVECLDSGRKLYFEISDRVNHLKRILAFYKSFDKRKTRIVSFNGIHFDSPVINYLIIHYHEFVNSTPLEICTRLHEFAQYIIETDLWWKDEPYKQYKYRQEWIDVDVFLYWSKMLRQTKRISLKSLGIQLGYPIVQELPYPPGSWLEPYQMDEVARYNYKHDLGILKLILTSKIYWQGKPTSIENEIVLRHNIRREHGLNAMSWDAPKIASELLLNFYCRHTQDNPWDVKKQKYAGGPRLKLHDPEFKLPVFQELYRDFQSASRDYKKEIVFIHNSTRIKLSYGIGGIHSVNNDEIYESDDNSIIITSDVSSLYPNLIINYDLIRQHIVLEQYKKIKVERMIAKKTGNKPKDATYKLILNSTSGLLDNQHSWLYYPEGAMKLRIMGQLVMTKVIEELAINNFRVVSANTDGVEVIVTRSREAEYYDIVNSVGKFFNLDFEHDIYKKIVYKNVNNYVAVNTQDKIKVKGSTFITTPNLGDSCNHLIVSKALVEYFTKGTDIETFIKQDHHIYDYCLSKKVDKTYQVVWGNQVLPQRLNRFYVSTRGRNLFKRKEGKDTHILKGWGVQIYNEHSDNQEHSIDYRFYISEARKIISELETANYTQLKLF